jgi:protein-S-isoprenylcysteine O-methyltransferase Ste14
MVSMSLLAILFTALCLLFALEEFVLIKAHSTIGESDPLSRRIELAAIWLPAIGIAVTGATMRSGGLRFGGAVNAAGVILCLAGLSLRYWSRRVLGRFFTIGVVRQEGHEVITGGPYRFVRHPGYLGLLFFYTGLPLVVGSRIGLLALTLPAVIVFVLLVVVEDDKLESALGDPYTAYRRKSWRLLPGIW